MKKILYICCLFLFLKCATTHPCSDTYLTPVLIGYPQSEVNALILRAYQPNGSFNQLVDTLLIPVYNSFSDSLFIDVSGAYTAKNHFSVMYPDHDWEIYIPARDTSIYISKIVSEKNTVRCWGCNCINPIISYEQNGKVVNPDSVGYNYLHSLLGYLIYVNNQ